MPESKFTPGPDEEVVAVVGGNLCSPCQANARLIAAAPELVKWLGCMCDLVTLIGHGWKLKKESWDDLQQAIAALKKAGIEV